MRYKVILKFFDGQVSAIDFLLALIFISALLCWSFYHKKIKLEHLFPSSLVSWFPFTFCQGDELARDQRAKWRWKVVCFWFYRLGGALELWLSQQWQSGPSCGGISSTINDTQSQPGSAPACWQLWTSRRSEVLSALVKTHFPHVLL